MLSPLSYLVKLVTYDIPIKDDIVAAH